MQQNTDKKVFGLTLPIITSESGEKFGKSAGNAVWLDQNLVSAYQFYQFFYNTSDQMVETYLKLFTFLPINEIEDIMQEHRVCFIFIFSSHTKCTVLI
jgi:tyrosyl-tRNA synthetase